MENIVILSLIKRAVWTGVQLGGPILLSALVIGLIISIFQATTQIQEPTLTFVPKLVVILLVVVVLSSWMLDKVGTLSLDMLNMISNIKGL